MFLEMDQKLFARVPNGSLNNFNMETKTIKNK